MITISAQLLESAGYNRWKSNPDDRFDFARWQKRIADAGGTKYFVNIKETLGWYDDTDEPNHNWWVSIQFDIQVGDTFRNIEVSLIQWFNESGQYSGITIDQMEQMCETIWSRLDGQYYETIG